MKNFPEISNIINFIFLIALLVYLLKKPVSEFLISRSKKIEDNIKESEALREEALQMLAKYKAKITSLDAEVEEILYKAKKDGEVEKEKILNRAQIIAQQIVDQAKRSVEIEAQNIKKNIEKQFMQKALTEAKDQIKQKASPSEHQMFVNYFIEQMEEQHGFKR